MSELTNTFLTRCLPPAIVGFVLALSLAFSAGQAHADVGDCGQPLSAGTSPLATDALILLRVAVGTQTCDLCICDVNNDAEITATDALLDLRAAVGHPVALDCAACADDVVVIAGSVETTVEELNPADFPDAASLVSSVFDIGPSGMMFPNTPAIVGIPIDLDTPADTNVVVAIFNEVTLEWVALEGSYIVGQTVFAPTNHFSIFAALGGLAQTCDNVWSGGPGSVAPLLVPGSIVVSGGVKTDEVITFSGPSAFAMQSTWTHPGCSATVMGNFAANPAGDGAWVDYSNPGQGGPIPHSGGNFAFTLNSPSGPFLGLADACQAGVGAVPYFLNVHFTGNCANLCQGVTCTANDGNPCTRDTCNQQTGTCEQAPTNGVCGSTNGGLCVGGLCMVEVQQLVGDTGNSRCIDQGLVCDSTPVLVPPHAACLAFHPTATVSSDVNGWRQGIYCNDNENRACAGRVNDCHDCPACRDDGLNCLVGGSTQIESVFASCVPAP